MNYQKEELENLLTLSKLDIEGEPPYDYVAKLNLSNCGLSSLPTSFPEAFPNLSILFMSNNSFREVPALIGQCPKLQMVAFKENGIESIHPDALQPQLRWLILTNNNLIEIPDTISRCTKLQKCMLSGNKLKTLPDMFACRNLELIRLASNQLEEPPMNLLKLPNLRWVGLSDNPFLKATIPPLPSLSVLDIDESQGKVLGEGAGGITRLCEYNGTSVACKEFRHTMTSDGLPEEERRINCAGLQSPCLIQVLGETTKGSLVMEYLDRFVPLAGPPSMESCSRDVYSDKIQLTKSQAETVLTGLLEALVQLHNHKGIMHGDFYAHNILVHQDDYSNVRLSDFGAAFFYDTKAPYGMLLQEIELRAWFVLAQEVSQILLEDHPWLDDFLKECQGHELAEVHIQWRQRQLSGLARDFDVDD